MEPARPGPSTAPVTADPRIDPIWDASPLPGDTAPRDAGPDRRAWATDYDEME